MKRIGDRVKYNIFLFYFIFYFFIKKIHYGIIERIRKGEITRTRKGNEFTISNYDISSRVNFLIIVIKNRRTSIIKFNFIFLDEIRLHFNEIIFFDIFFDEKKVSEPFRRSIRIGNLIFLVRMPKKLNSMKIMQ